MSAEADRIRSAFFDALRSESGSFATMAELAASSSDDTIRALFLDLGRAGREFYLVHDVGFIAVHVRSEDKGWWGILKTVKKDLDILRSRLRQKCYYVLLIGRGDRFIADGYIATDFSTSPFLKPPGVDKTKYTVNEKQHLDPRKRLLSLEKVAKVVMTLRNQTDDAAPK